MINDGKTLNIYIHGGLNLLGCRKFFPFVILQAYGQHFEATWPLVWMANPPGHHLGRWRKYIIYIYPINYWLVVSTPLKNISQLGWIFPKYGNIFQTMNKIIIIIYGYPKQHFCMNWALDSSRSISAQQLSAQIFSLSTGLPFVVPRQPRRVLQAMASTVDADDHEEAQGHQIDGNATDIRASSRHGVWKISWWSRREPNVWPCVT